MGEVLLTQHKDTRRRSQIEQALAQAQAQKEQYKHHALLHKLHTINCEFIQRQLTQRLRWHTDKSSLFKERWAMTKHLKALQDATTRD